MNEELRNGLWSAFYSAIAQSGRQYGEDVLSTSSQYYHLLVALWKKFYKLPIDQLPNASYYGSYSESVKFVREMFYKLAWFDAYNFLEFTAQNVSDGFPEKARFISGCNEALRQEMAGYRFVNDEITQITSEGEIAEIEQAINEASTSAVSAHLSRALELLSDKTEPDYRNSIKESISAVEALCANLTGVHQRLLDKHSNVLMLMGQLRRILR